MRVFRLTAAVLPIWMVVVGCTPRNVQTNAGSGGPRSPKTILSVLAGQSTSDAGTEEMINELLRKRVPDIQLEWQRVDWGDRFEAQMHASFAAGEVPDIMIGKAQDVKTYVPTDNIAPAPKSLVALIDKVALPSVTVNGQVYGLPYNAFYQGVFYNKELFAKRGYAVPKTQLQLTALIAKMKKANITPFAAHFEEDWFVGNIVMQFAMGEVFNRTPNWGDRFRARKVSFSNSEGFHQVFADVKEILNNSWPDALAIAQAECDERFAKGQAAMYLTGTWTLQTINAVTPHMNVGIFPFPNRAGDAKLIFEPNMTFMSSSKSPHPGAIERVLRAIFDSKDLASEIFDYTKTSSMLKSIKPDVPLLIQSDVNGYHRKDMITDVTVGNNQLIWSFQDELAKRLQNWLRGSVDLQSVLNYADRNRSLSAP